MSSAIKQRESTVKSDRSRHRYSLPPKIKYAFRAGHHKGHGIHSPYLYHLITDILANNYPYYCFESIETALKKHPEFQSVKANRQLLSRHFPNSQSTETRIANSRIIFRLALDMAADYIVETCYCGDPDSVYVAKARPTAHRLCLSTSPEQTNAAEKLFRFFEVPSEGCLINPEAGEVKNSLASFPRVDLVLFNTHPDRQLLLDLFQLCLEKKQTSSIFVFKNIHRSKNMETVWNLVKAHPAVSVSLDIFSMGLLLFRPDLEKRAYIIRK